MHQLNRFAYRELSLDNLEWENNINPKARKEYKKYFDHISNRNSSSNNYLGDFTDRLHKRLIVDSK